MGIIDLGQYSLQMEKAGAPTSSSSRDRVLCFDLGSRSCYLTCEIPTS